MLRPVETPTREIKKLDGRRHKKQIPLIMLNPAR